MNTRELINKNYISMFYEDKKDTVYPIKGCNEKVIDKAISIYHNCGGYDSSYLFDTVDRERIRYVIESLLGMNTKPLL